MSTSSDQTNIMSAFQALRDFLIENGLTFIHFDVSLQPGGWHVTFEPETLVREDAVKLMKLLPPDTKMSAFDDDVLYFVIAA